MPERFHSLDARLGRDMRSLRDSLWVPGWAGDVDTLRADILRDARTLDRFLGAGGALSRNVVALSRGIRRRPEGGLLFEFLSTVHRLAGATESLRRGDVDGASDAAARVAEALSIGACSLIRRFDLVEDWKNARTGFETYTRDLADALERKGFAGAGELKRMLNVAHGLGQSKTRSKEERVIAAKAAVASALWCGIAVVRLRKSLGTLPAIPFRDYSRILAKIASRF